MDMRIANVYNAYSVYNANNTNKAGKAADKAGVWKDTFSISGQGGEFAQVLKAVAEAPDVRADRVEAIRAAIDAGRYNVPAAEVAARLLRDIEED
jgi:negative regulator of flagellin synthesis FlgM